MKVSAFDRIAAKVVDLIIVMLVPFLLPVVLGPLCGFCYSLIADGFQVGPLSGQSIGKKLFGLRVLNVITGKPANFKDSAIRNLPVGVATFFAIIPPLGWVFLFLVGIPLMVMEIYLMKRVEYGHRLGDVMADTEVVVTGEKTRFADVIHRAKVKTEEKLKERRHK